MNYENKNFVKTKHRIKNKSIKRKKNMMLQKDRYDDKYEDIFSYYEKNERNKKNKLSSRGTIFIF
jgi:hypothetical protein